MNGIKLVPRRPSRHFSLTGSPAGAMALRFSASRLSRGAAFSSPDLELHLILDNSSTHKTPLIRRWLLRHRRVRLHFTPTSASWLKLVECWFPLLTTRRLARGAFR